MAKTTQQSTTFIQTNQSSKTTITLPNNKNLSVFKSITDESSTRITQATKSNYLPSPLPSTDINFTILIL